MADYQMLRELLVQNLALIEDVHIEFGTGFHVLTGETGAGKSILVGAIELLLGARASSETVRQGAASGRVEGVFEVRRGTPTYSAAQELGIPIDDKQELVLTREVLATGRSRAKANGHLLSLPMLKRLGDTMVDIHGQHQHQSLLRPGEHVYFLDAYGGLIPLREEFGSALADWEGTRARLEEEKGRLRRIEAELDFKQFQLKEIEDADPQPGEDRKLEEELQILKHGEHLRELLHGIYGGLEGEPGSVTESLRRVRGLLQEAVKIDQRLEEESGEVDSSLFALEDAATAVRRRLDHLDLDPERLEMAQERIHLLNRLKRKHGGTIEGVLESKERLTRELEEVSGGEGRIRELEEAVGCQEEAAARLGSSLSKKRRKAAEEFGVAVAKQLAQIAMPDVRFEVMVSFEEDPSGLPVGGRRLAANPWGVDRIEFMFSANPGEDLRPLARIASGGEVSRVMLALKSLLAQVDRVGTLVFDEIDSGIGGRTASVVGAKLSQIAHERQVLCVTHLPQIASRAAAHYEVRREVSQGRTRTLVELLAEEDRIPEIARMLGEPTADGSTMEHAKRFLERAREGNQGRGK